MGILIQITNKPLVIEFFLAKKNNFKERNTKNVNK